MKMGFAVLAALLSSTAPSLAQAPAVSQNYCLSPRGENPPPLQHCVHATLSDCEASKKNESESCVPNPYLTFPHQAEREHLPPEARR